MSTNSSFGINRSVPVGSTGRDLRHALQVGVEERARFEIVLAVVLEHPAGAPGDQRPPRQQGEGGGEDRDADAQPQPPVPPGIRPAAIHVPLSRWHR